MSDSTSAQIFGMVFDALARIQKGEMTLEEAAQELYKISRDYDFYEGEMDCAEALKALGVKKA